MIQWSTEVRRRYSTLITTLGSIVLVQVIIAVVSDIFVLCVSRTDVSRKLWILSISHILVVMQILAISAYMTFWRYYEL